MRGVTFHYNKKNETIFSITKHLLRHFLWLNHIVQTRVKCLKNFFAAKKCTSRLYISTSVWVHAGWNSHFQRGFCLKAEKTQKSNKFAAKTLQKMDFLSLHKNAGQVFYSQKKLFLLKKTTFYLLITTTLGYFRVIGCKTF